MATKGESLFQRGEIADLTTRLAAVQADLNLKVNQDKYDGKINLLEANDLRHDADIARLEATTVLKATYNADILRLDNKDAFHDGRIQTLNDLANTKISSSDYNIAMLALDEVDDDHEMRIVALEKGVTGLYNDIQNVINSKLEEKIDETVFNALKTELEKADTKFAQQIANLTSSAVQDAIDAAQNTIIGGKVNQSDYDPKVAELEDKNLDWEKRLNAVDQYIRAMIQTYEIKLGGNTYEYTAESQAGVASNITKKHFQIIGRMANNVLVVEMAPFAFNTFYGELQYFIGGNTTATPAVAVKKLNTAVNSATRRVTLNPNLQSVSFPLVVRLTDSAGNELHTETLSQENFQNPVNTPMLLVPTFKYDFSSKTLVAKKEAISFAKEYTFAPVTVDGDIASLTYTLGNGTKLPIGLDLDPNGIIYGVPTTIQSEAVVDIIGTDGSGNKTGVQLKFTVVAVPDVPSYPAIPTLSRNISIANAYVPTNPANNIVNYSIDPEFPVKSGLFFNRTTGAISGTPTIVQNNVSYTVKANGIEAATGGYGSTVITINVLEAPPAFDYLDTSKSPSTNTYNLALNVAMPDIMPNIGNTSGPIKDTNGWSIANGSLPPGMSFDANSGKFYCDVVDNVQAVLTSAGTTNLTVKAAGVGGDYSANITFIVSANIPIISYNGANIYTQDIELTTPLKPTVASNSGPIKATGGYAMFKNNVDISAADKNDQRAGLSFNVDTGVISGTPTAELATTGFTVVATGSDGASDAAGFYITVKKPVPVIAYAAGLKSGVRGVDLVSFAPTATNGPTFFGIDKVLPFGLNFNNATGEVTGKPLVTSMPAVTYTVIAYNSGGESIPATFGLEITEPAPEIQYNTGSLVFTVGEEIEEIVPSLAKNQISTWSQTGLRPGLTFANGVIDGAPSERSNGPVTVTVTATGSNGLTDTADIEMTVNEPKAVFNYGNNSSYTLAKGVPVTISPTVTNNVSVAPNGWAVVSGSVPGLTFDSATGAFDGAPSGVTGEVSIVVRATNLDGIVSNNVTLKINVNDEPPAEAVSYTQADGSEYTMKVLVDGSDKTVYLKKDSGSASGQLARYDAATNTYTAFGSSGVVTLANGDFYAFSVDSTQTYDRLAFVSDLGGADQSALAHFYEPQA